MSRYRRASNSGPVPYPDKSGRMLTNEIVEGDEWAQYVPLDYVVKVEEVAIAAPVATVATVFDRKPSGIIAEGEADVAWSDDGGGASPVDPSSPGRSDAEGPAVGRTAKRRSQRS